MIISDLRLLSQFTRSGNFFYFAGAKCLMLGRRIYFYRDQSMIDFEVIDVLEPE